MGHRALPTAAETVGVMRHLADVAALKADRAGQRRLLVDGLNDLFGTALGWVYTIDDCRPGQPLRPVMGELTSNPDAAWVRYMADFAATLPVPADPFADSVMRTDDVEQQWTLPRVLPDLAAHRRYAAAADLTATVAITDSAFCAFRTGPALDRTIGFSLHRCRGDPRMRPRDFALQRFALTEIHRLHDRGHLPSMVPAPRTHPMSDPASRLPPRQRQVLDRLLLGHPPKAIAHELGLSVWTVRDHVKRLYTHFGTNGRDELMARFVDPPPDGDA